MDSSKSRNDKIFDIILEEAVHKYAQDVANEEIECDMTDEEIKIMMEQKQYIYKKLQKKILNPLEPHSRFSVKKIVILAAVITAVLMLGINVTAFRKAVFNLYTDINGTYLSINSNKIDPEKYSSIVNFSRKNEILIPDWVPDGMEIEDIEDDVVSVTIRYVSEDDEWICINICDISSSNFVSNVETEQNYVNTEDCKVLDMDGKIISFINESGVAVYNTVWRSDTALYYVQTNISEKNLKKFLKNLKFFEEK